jgi:phage I-like protein
VTKEILILPFQTFYDSRFGRVEHSKRIAEQLIKNLERRLVPYPIPVLLSHKSDSGKYGEVKTLRMKSEGLAADIEFNEEGEKLIKSGRYDFLSPAYHENYVNKATGQGEGETLVEVSLTPIPAQPGMQRITLTDADGDKELVTWNVEIDIEADEKTNKGAKRMPPDTTEFSVIKRYEEELADLKTQNKQFEEKLEAQAETLTKQFGEQMKEKDGQIKKLTDDLGAIKKEKHALHVKQWADGWLAKNKTPALIKTLSDKLLEDETQETFFDSILEATTGIPTNRLIGYSEAITPPEGLDIDKLARTLAGVEVK